MPPNMNSGDEVFGRALRDFLCKPDRKQFRQLFEHSFVRCRNYLRYLRGRQWSLPLDARTDRDPVDDLAIDVLGSLFRSKKDKPFHIVLDYFNQLGITEYRTVDPERLAGLFVALLNGFTRQELFRIYKTVNPELARIKRRSKDILKGEEYTFVSEANDSRKYVCHVSFAVNLRREAKLVDRNLLEELVTYSLLRTKKDTDLCRMFFQRLNEIKEYQNFVALNEFLSVMVSARATYAEEGFPAPSPMPSPEIELLQGKVEEAKERALAKVWQIDIKRFISRRRITEEEGQAFHKACRLYLDDHCNGGADPIPQYFRECVPSVSQEIYLSKYKYSLETVVDRALAYMRQDLGDDPTITGFGDY